MFINNNLKDLTLFCYDNPISRSYINMFIENNFKFNEIIYLVNFKYYLFPNSISSYLNFLRNNHWPLKLLKNKSFNNIFLTLTNLFDVNKNYFNEMYNYRNLFKATKKITFIKFQNINSKVNLKHLNNSESNNILFSGGGILKKEILNIDKKFIHIHPGYLPKVRGADGLLWSLKMHNHIGVSSFYMNDKIDSGEIIMREKYNAFKIKDNDILKYSHKEIYNFIYSFIDPLIRSNHLKKILLNYDLNNIKTIPNNIKTGKYYSFMKESESEEIFKKLFI